MKRSKHLVDTLRGLVPDHIKIMWLDEEFDCAKAPKGKPVVCKWADGRIEHFDSLNSFCSQYDVSGTAMEKCIRQKRHISVIEGYPRLFWGTDPAALLPVELPEESERVGAKKVRAHLPGGKVLEFPSVRKCADSLMIHKQTIINAIYQERPIRSGAWFEYVEEKK